MAKPTTFMVEQALNAPLNMAARLSLLHVALSELINAAKEVRVLNDHNTIERLRHVRGEAEVALQEDYAQEAAVIRRSGDLFPSERILRDESRNPDHCDERRWVESSAQALGFEGDPFDPF